MIQHYAAFVIPVLLSTAGHAQVFDWAGQLGGASNQDAYAVQVSPDGFVYMAGYFQVSIDLDPTPGQDIVSAVGGQNGYVVKLANDGSYIWGRHFSGSTCMATALAFGLDGSILIAGTFTGTVDFDPGPGVANLTAPASTWYFLCGLSPDGQYQWARRFGSGDPLYDPAIAVDQQGRIHFTGTFSGTMDANPNDEPGAVHDLASNGTLDVFITTFDAQGNFIRAMSFGGTGEDRGRAIAVAPDGHVLVAGQYVGTVTIPSSAGGITLANNSGASYNDIFYLKMDPDGDVLWAKKIGGSGYDRAYALTVGPNGDIYLAGSVESGADLDPGPGVVTSNSPEAAFYVRLDADGNYINSFVTQYGGASDNQARAIGLDAAGNVYFAGRFNGAGSGVDFDPGPGSTAYVTNGVSADGFIAAYAADASYLWSVQVGSIASGQEWIYDLAVDPAGSCYAVGHFTSDIDMDPGTGTHIFNVIGSSSRDAFILKLDPVGLDLPEGMYGGADLVVWPNPSNGPLRVELPGKSGRARMRIMDASGRVVHAGTVLLGAGGGSDGMPVAPGLYVVEVEQGGVTHRAQWVRQ
ncbi:MAG: T9SS type A sorting domain-containing protein [Flavobacteriales bacterium]|nr:T9SS type A sorting domain-containing protein [Flavobacteriales bacterium]